MIVGINVTIQCDKCKECTILTMPIEKDNECICCGHKLINSDNYLAEFYLKIGKLIKGKYE